MCLCKDLVLALDWKGWYFLFTTDVCVCMNWPALFWRYIWYNLRYLQNRKTEKRNPLMGMFYDCWSLAARIFTTALFIMSRSWNQFKCYQWWQIKSMLLHINVLYSHQTSLKGAGVSQWVKPLFPMSEWHIRMLAVVLVALPPVQLPVIKLR